MLILPVEPISITSILNQDAAFMRSLITKREKEILKLISEGYTSQEIGEALYISQHTVLSHRKNLIDKLDVRNSAHMIMRCVELGMLGCNYK